MTIDRVNSGTRLSGIGDLAPKETQVKGEGGGGEPPKHISKGQKFFKQLGKDLSFIPALVAGPFRGISNLVKSIGRAKEALDTKHERLGELRERRGQLETEREAKIAEIRQTVQKLLEAIPVTELDDEAIKQKVNEFYEQVFDNPELNSNQTTPATVRNLKKRDEGTAKILQGQIDQLKSIHEQIQDTDKEHHKLEKLGPGKIVGKVVKTGLLTVAAPALSVMSGVLMAPFLPLWGGVAMLRAGVYAETGKILGSKSGEIREQLKLNIALGLDG